MQTFDMTLSEIFHINRRGYVYEKVPQFLRDAKISDVPYDMIKRAIFRTLRKTSEVAFKNQGIEWCEFFLNANYAHHEKFFFFVASCPFIDLGYRQTMLAKNRTQREEYGPIFCPFHDTFAPMRHKWRLFLRGYRMFEDGFCKCGKHQKGVFRNIKGFKAHVKKQNNWYHDMLLFYFEALYGKKSTMISDCKAKPTKPNR